MKLVIAIIRPEKLEPVRDALSAAGIKGLTASEVKGFGRQKGHLEIYRGAEYTVTFVPKIKIEVGIAKDQVPLVIETITKETCTGSIGDGKIFIVDLPEAVRIRTGDRNVDAL